MPADADEVTSVPAPSFVRRALVVIGLVTLVAAIAMLLWSAVDIFLLAFAAVLLATFLNTGARLLSTRTPVPHGVALALVILILLAASTLFWILAGPPVAEQATDLIDRVPASQERWSDFLSDVPGGDWILDRVSASGPEALAGQGFVSRVTGTASLFWEAMARVVFVFFLALYLAASPRTYRDGLAALVPPKRRERATEILDQIGRALQGWILGQLVSMLLVGLMVWLGLTIIGVPLALVLGLLAGLFEFVPIVGPVLAYVPAVIVASSLGFHEVLWVTGLYVVIQQLEGHLVVPLVQRHAIDLPPALTIGAVFVGGAAFGPVGLLVATPLAAVGLVLVDMIYRHDILGEHVELPAGGEE